MALCLECKADYLPHITVCPACNRALEPGPPTAPPLSANFVPLMGAGYVEGLAAAASLEAAGLEARMTTADFSIYLGTPLHVTVHVREKDLDAACSALKKPAPPRPSPDTPAELCDSQGKVDKDVVEAVLALNDRPGVRTVCSCSGSHPGASEGFISLAPAGTDPEIEKLFDRFVNGLQKRVRGSNLSDHVAVEWSAVHGAEINLVDPRAARQTWDALARLVDALPR